MNSQNVSTNNDTATVNTEVNQSPMISIVNCTEFAQCRKDMYETIPIESAFSFDSVERNFSRYEVLSNTIRKLYFDIDGIPLTDENLVHEFMREYEEFFKTKIKNISSDFTEPFKYVITSNKNSSTHPGLSYHIIVWNYCMYYLDQKRILSIFKNSSAGTKYIQYIDTSVYSSLRLFKVPNFIGIPIDANPENYHRPDASDKNISHYIIQDTSNTKQLHIIDGIKREEYQQNALVKNNLSNMNWEFCIQLYNLIKSLDTEQFDKKLNERKLFRKDARNKNKHIEEQNIANEINYILNCELISRNDKNKLVKIAKMRNNNLISALIEQLRRKYIISIELPSNRFSCFN